MRTIEKISEEIGEVSSAQAVAEWNVLRCIERMQELRGELAEAEEKEE